MWKTMSAPATRGASTDVEKVGQLEVGKEITVVAVLSHHDGNKVHHQVKFKGGWVPFDVPREAVKDEAPAHKRLLKAKNLLLPVRRAPSAFRTLYWPCITYSC